MHGVAWPGVVFRWGLWRCACVACGGACMCVRALAPPQIAALMSEVYPDGEVVRKIVVSGMAGLPARVAAFQKLFRTKRGGDDVIGFLEGAAQLKRQGILLECVRD